MTTNIYLELPTSLKCLLTRIFITVLLFFIYNGLNAQVIDYTTLVRYEKGAVSTQTSFIIQINDADQRDNGEISIAHGADENFQVLYAEITDASGNVMKKLKKKEISSRSRVSGSTFHQDRLVTELSLYHNEYPYRIKYAYRSESENYTYLANWTPFYKGSIGPIKSTLSLDVPENYKVEIHSNLDKEASVQIDNGRKISTWETVLPQLHEPENYSPIYWEFVPRVVVAPEEFHYGVAGKLSSWKDYGQWFLDLNVDMLDLTEEEKLHVVKILNGLTNDVEKITALYHYLQDNTTYVNVSLDLGGLQSYPASYVCTNKYGDCKALTTYMKALLNYAGIQSNYVIIDAGNDLYTDGWINEDIPGPQFNHIILGVPLESDTIWLENTSTTAPFGYVGTFIQNRKALWVKPNGSHLVSIPALSQEDVENHKTFHFTLDDSGNGSLEITFDLRAEEFERMAYREKNLKESDLELRLKKSFNSSEFSIDQWQLASRNRDDKSLVINLQGSVTEQVRNVGNIHAISPPLISLPEFSKPEKRVTDVKINIPINEKYTCIYDIKGLDSTKIQTEQKYITSAYGSYNFLTKLENGQLVSEETFVLNSGKIPLAAYQKFYDFIHEVTKIRKRISIIY